MIACADLTTFLEGPGSVTYTTDGYGRVWAKVDGNCRLHGPIDEPLPYLLEVTGAVTVDLSEIRCPHLKAAEVYLNNATEPLCGVEILARIALVTDKASYPHLSKTTRRCNRVHLA